MAVEQTQVQLGALVFGLDGTKVGVVKMLRSSDFLVDRRLHRDIYIPYDAVREVLGDQLGLVIPASEVDRMGWEQPPLFERHIGI